MSSLFGNGRIYRLKITLAESNPPIWRRIEVPEGTSLPFVHEILQLVMGWQDYHGHQFMVGDLSSTTPPFCGEDFERNEAGYSLNHILSQKGETIIYEYDYGDGWEHEIL